MVGRGMVWGCGGMAVWGAVGGVVGWLAEVAGAGDGQLEAIYVEAFLIGVAQQPHKIVFLQAGRVVVGVDEGAGGPRVHALLQALCLGVGLIARAVTLGVVFVRQVHYHLLKTRLGVWIRDQDDE